MIGTLLRRSDNFICRRHCNWSNYRI